MVKLRDYQTEAVNRGLAHLRTRNSAGLLVLPTGSGKSLVIADICHKLGAPVLILQPSKELLDQNYAKLRAYGIEDIGIYSASKKSREIARYTYATIGSIERRPEEFTRFKYVLIDEAHLVAPGGRYEKFLAAIGSPPVIGLTATPYRLQSFHRTDQDGKDWLQTYLKTLIAPGQFFDSVVINIDMAPLMDAGYLSRPTYKAVGAGAQHARLRPNSSGTEYSDKSVATFWDEGSMLRLGMWLATYPHKRILVFCPSVEVAETMQARVMGSVTIDGTMKPKDRDERLAAFAAGSVKIVFNVGVLTTGYDLPSLDAVVLMRPTMSLNLYMQMVGRVLRVNPDDPEARGVVYDASGNFGRFGAVEAVRLDERDEIVYAGNRQMSGLMLGEVCLTDIAARRKAKV